MTVHSRTWLLTVAVLLLAGGLAPAGAAPPALVVAGAPNASTPSSVTVADWRSTVRDFAAKHFRQPAWGYSHVVRDYSLAHELASRDGVALDDDVLFAAAYLHDMGTFPPWADPKADHADTAADHVHELLDGTGFPMTKIDAVRAAIRTHMYFRDPSGPEAVYLHDADALDWLGAVGVARIMALVDPQGGTPDGPTMARRLEENLAVVPAHVVSPAGRALVPARRTELEVFLRDLKRESADFANL